jgi:hypothetical protein
MEESGFRAILLCMRALGADSPNNQMRPSHNQLMRQHPTDTNTGPGYNANSDTDAKIYASRMQGRDPKNTGMH